MSNICKEKVEKLITISILMSFSKTPPKQTVEKKLTKYFKKMLYKLGIEYFQIF
jgi:hypothetical protein